MAEEDLGEDWGGVADIDPHLSDVTGRRALLECVARRWWDLAGSLFYDRGYGKGLAAYLSAVVQSPSTIEAALEDEALKDERVQACSVSVTVAGESLSISGSITDDEGPFAFTVMASKLDVKALLENSVQ